MVVGNFLQNVKKKKKRKKKEGSLIKIKVKEGKIENCFFFFQLCFF